MRELLILSYLTEDSTVTEGQVSFISKWHGSIEDKMEDSRLVKVARRVRRISNDLE